MSGALRIALVGSGSMGRNHARVIATGPRTELAAVIDPHEESGRAVADQYGSAWQPDLDGIGGFDAVVVAAATEAHHDIAAQVIDAGRPLLVEKPLCPSLEQSEDLVRASEAAGTPLMCGFLERFNPAVMTAMKMIEAPVYVRAQRHSPYAPRIKTGVAWDLLVHDVDLVVRAFGEQQPESFDVSVGQFHPSSVPGAEDVVEAGVRFTGGGIASVSASRLGQVKVRSMVIQELDRMIEIDLLRRGLTSYRHSSIEPDDAFVGFRQFTEIEVPEIGGAEPLVSQLAHFVDLVEGVVDADTERASILPAHRVVDEVLRTR